MEKNKLKKISDEQFIAALKDSENIHQAIIKVGSTNGRLYGRAYELLAQDNISLKEKEPKKEKKCLQCGALISRNATYCEKCYHLLTRQIERPSRDELKKLIRNTSFIQIGKSFNVSDNAIRKWCKAENLPYKKTEINKFSDEEWEKI